MEPKEKAGKLAGDRSAELAAMHRVTPKPAPMPVWDLRAFDSTMTFN
jgi:hypothetical protein